VLDASSDPRERERFLVARMATTGYYSVWITATAVRCVTSCVQTWLTKFVAGGVEALIKCVKSTGRNTKLTGPIAEAALPSVTAKLGRVPITLRGRCLAA
jgi:hypothetical protein